MIVWCVCVKRQRRRTGFYRYAITMEEASEVERNKVSRPYDGMAQLSEQQKQMAAQLLTTAGTLERGYQAFLGSGNLQVFQPQVKEMDKLRQQWIADLETFRGVLRTQSIDPKTLVAVKKVFQRLADRIKNLAN